MRTARWLIVAATAAAWGCVPRAIQLPTAQSPEPVARDTGGLHAGFARVDITPPPGPAMVGYGTEGKAAHGYRGRLYARAMVLEDRRGERLAIVGLDLGMASVLLHRRVAALTRDTPVAIGADRLLLSGTHTHSGPGNFFGVPGIDAFASTRGGYDARLTDFLIARIALAVRMAADSLRPARAAWAVDTVWGQTRIRSDSAFRSNSPPWRYPHPPAGLDSLQAGVDPAWRMLRVDVMRDGKWVPRGAFSIFAIHGTAIPGANELFDPDVHGIVSRAVEAHVDELAGRGEAMRRWGVHLFGNGAEGDVSPVFTDESRCPTPEIGRARRLSGPRTPPQPDYWVPVADTAFDRCLRHGKRLADTLGRTLAAKAVRQFDRLGAHMDSLDAELTRGLRIERAFATLPLVRSTETGDLCPEPRVGTGFAGGAEDGRSRLYGWRLLGFVPPGFAMDHDTAYRGLTCHRQKRLALGRLGLLQGIVAGPHGLPEVAQVSAVRIGGLVIGTLPAEPTTTVGARIRAAMAWHAGMQPDSVAVMAVTNGYIQYITTPEEYRFQYYEGGATEFGPWESWFFQDALSRLAATLRPSSTGAPPGRVTPLTAFRGEGLESFPDSGGPTESRITRAFREYRWRGDTLVVRWNDVRPGRLIPADAPVLAVERQDGGEWRTVTWDDDNELEVRGVRRLGGRGYEWEARWRPCRRPAGETYRIVLLERPGLPPLTGEGLRSGPVPRCEDDLRP
ncbi:MAG TPA: neutral/alkaline non-lysosomal ceramidase N-terminal domain-containing protein [Longimicrobium sp.]